MLLRSAMRYYRLWIYSCNGVLLLSVLVFLAVGGSVLADMRMRFVPIALYHPTLLYGYAALLLQAGVIQAVGCVSAIRLNERWLNVYWLLMLMLLIGDVLVGLCWVFIFSNITSGLPAHMRNKLHIEYGSNSHNSKLWDILQQEYNCCGAQTPMDYNGTRWFLLSRPQQRTQDFLKNDTRWWTSFSASSSSSPRSALIPGAKRSNDVMDFDVQPGLTKKPPPSSPSPWLIPPSCCYHNDSAGSCATKGCAEPILLWLQRSADLLFVLGYCVIAFLKLCFLGILRYEIREMIQKIRLLQGELHALPDLATIGMPSPEHQPNHVDKRSNGNNNDLEMKELGSHR